MKILVAIASLVVLSQYSFAQETPDQIMEQRAREMVRVLGLSDKNEYRNFIKENYTEALINKSMRRVVDGGEAAQKKTDDPAANLEAKVGMYEMIHSDLGTGKVTSMKREGDILKVSVKGNTPGKMEFSIKFQKQAPYLIDGLGIEMTADQ